MKSLRFACICLVVVIVAGCYTTGKDFPGISATYIQKGETTRSQIKDMFGEPYQVGLDDGNEAWTYFLGHYTLLGEQKEKQLYIVFDGRGRVKNYQFQNNF